MPNMPENRAPSNSQDDNGDGPCRSLIANPVKRYAIAETIIAEHRVNGRRLTRLESLLLVYFAIHCGATLPDGWEVSLERLRTIYDAEPQTLSTAIKTLRTEGLINSKQAGRNPSRYTLGRAFYQDSRLNKRLKSNNLDFTESLSQNYRKSEVEVLEPYLHDYKQDSTHRAHASQNQIQTLEQMLQERGLDWKDIVSQWNRIPGVTDVPPADPEGLLRKDYQPVFEYVKGRRKNANARTRRNLQGVGTGEEATDGGWGDTLAAQITRERFEL